MLGLDVKIDDSSVRKTLAEIESRAGDLAPAMARIGAYIAGRAGGGLSFAASNNSVTVRTPLIYARLPRKSAKGGPSLRSLRAAPMRPLPAIGEGDMAFFAEIIGQHLFINR